MEWINALLSERLISTIGITILHSLWLGFIISLFLAFALFVLRNSDSKVRYHVSGIAIILLFISVSIIFVSSYNNNEIHKSTLRSKVYVNESNFDKEGRINLSLKDADEKGTASYSEYTKNIQQYFSEFMPATVMIWFVGVIFFTLRMLGGFLYTQRIKHHKVFVPEGEWQIKVNDLASRMDISRQVTLLESALVKIPVMIGHFKPVILMPLGLLSGLSMEEVEAVLAHELAHIKRFDYLLNILQNMLEVIFFYHPAVWWISGIIKREREIVCDDIAVSIINDKLSYSKALISLQDAAIGKTELAMTLFKRKNELLGRIKRMVQNKKTSNISGRLVSIFFITLVAVVMISACSSVNDDYSYEYGDEYKEFINEYPHGRHTLHFEDDENNSWRVRLNDGEIVSVHKNGERISQSEIKDLKRFIKNEIKRVRRQYDWQDSEFAQGNKKFEHDMQNFREQMHDLQEELKDIHIKTRVHFDDSNLRESLRELKDNLKDIRVNIDEDKIRFDFDDDFDFNFDFDFDKDFDIDVDLGDFGERMGKFGECMGKIGEDLKDYRVDMEEFEENMEEFGEKMDELGLDMNDLKREMKKLKQFLLEVKEELVNDGYIEDLDDDITLEFEDDYLYIDNRQVDDSVRRKYENIYKKYFDDEPDDHWRMEL